MNRIIIANIITAFADGFLLLGSTRKSKNETLICQIMFMLLLCVANILLVAYSAALVNLVGIFRNVIVINEKNTYSVNIFILALSTGLGLYFNSNALLGYLPIIISFIETFFVLKKGMTTRDIKLLYVFIGLCWAIFNIFVRNYVGSIFNFASSIFYLFFAKKSKATA